MKTWLVEIRVKDWIATKTPVLDYVEIRTSDYCDMFGARRTGFDEFVRRIKYQPQLKKKVEIICSVNFDSEKAVAYSNYFCAPDAVCLS